MTILYDKAVTNNVTCTYFISYPVFSTKQNGFTPLYNASDKGHTSTVEVLLRNGADPNLATTVSMEVH